MPASARVDKFRIFISYSRHDAIEADAIVDALQARGLDVTIDRRDLPFGEKWQAELSEFIRLCDTAIWLVSDYSVRSEWVNWELDEVAKRSKRLVPVRIGETPLDRLPRQLGEIHILPADRLFDLKCDLDMLVQVLETDRPWLKEASRLQDRASEWLAKARSPSLLLSRGALDAAERWKESRPPKAPSPAQDVLDLLLASRQAATRRQRWWVAGSAATTLFALTLAGFSYVQRNNAIVQRNEAERQRNVAEYQRRVTQELREQTQKTESGLLAHTARGLLSDGKEWSKITSAVLLTLEALPDAAGNVVRPYVSEAEWQLDRANRELRELFRLNHGGSVNVAAFSPDGARILTASTDETARVWDAATGKELSRLVHERSVNKAAFSPDGARIITASDDKTARVWDAAMGKELARLEHEGFVWAAAFSPDGTRIVTASGDNTARVWNAATGQELAKFGPDGGINAAAFSADGARIVTASSYHAARVWDAATGKELARLSHEGSVNKAAFSDDGIRIVTASDDKTARVWEAATGKELARLSHEDKVSMAAFSPDGTRVVTASDDKTARVWDAATGEELARLGHEDAVNAAAFSPDGTRIVTASDDKTARVWETATGKELAKLGHDYDVRAATFSPDGIRIVTASGYSLLVMGDARVWDAATGKELARLGHEDEVRAVAFSPDGTHIITASDDKTARVWDAATGKELVRFNHKGRVWAAAFSPDGTRTITASSDKTARVWDAATGKELAKLGHEEHVSTTSYIMIDEFTKLSQKNHLGAAAFSSDASGKYLWIVLGKSAYLWRVERSTDDLVQIAKRRVTRCLTQAERAQFFLPAAPPVWCITGAGLEAEKNPGKWQPKWPYQSPAWRDWLVARQRGQTPPAPVEK